MPTLGDVSFLLRKLEIIKLKYAAQYAEGNFNLFSILRQEHDEVHLHSAFIAELLNPRGSHGRGCVFLQHFLAELNICADSALSDRNVSIEVEHRFPDHGQIDVLLQLPGRIIVLENKI